MISTIQNYCPFLTMILHLPLESFLAVEMQQRPAPDQTAQVVQGEGESWEPLCLKQAAMQVPYRSDGGIFVHSAAFEED